VEVKITKIFNNFMRQQHWTVLLFIAIIIMLLMEAGLAM